jgi:putative sigma-54 modulation protein
MKVYYTGKHDVLTPAQRNRLEAKFHKLARILDMKQGEREAHVILTQERHIQRAEITVRFHDRNLVSIGLGPEVFPAILDAAEKLERQILKQREKMRDTKRAPKPEKAAPEEAEGAPAEAVEEAEVEAESGRRVYRSNHHERRKPMTLEEALLEIERDRDYVVYRDAETDRVSVLVRRRDGDYELIEA